jgi:hypothetical protein
MKATKWCISYHITYDHNCKTSVGNFTTWNTNGTPLEMNLDEARKQIAKFIHDNPNVVPPEFIDTCNIVVLGWSVEVY